MDITTLTTVALGSSLLSSLLTLIFTKAKDDKDFLVENITKERKEWRDKIRAIAEDVTHAFLSKSAQHIFCAETKLIVLLNPGDKHDQCIISTLSEIKTTWREDKLEEFNDRLAYLLKHDWERVKMEIAGPISPQGLLLATLTCLLATMFFDYALSDNNNLSLVAAIIFCFVIGMTMLFNWLLSVISKSHPLSKSCFSLIGRLAAFMQNSKFREAYKRRADR